MRRCWSSSAQTFFPGFKEFSERARIRLVGADLDRVDVVGTEHSQELGLMALTTFEERGATALVVGVDFDDFTGFGVFQDKTAEWWEFEFVTVDDLDGDEV